MLVSIMRRLGLSLLRDRFRPSLQLRPLGLQVRRRAEAELPDGPLELSGDGAPGRQLLAVFAVRNGIFS